MELGRFSVSLVVADIEKSMEFYSVLGFEVVEGGHKYEGQFGDTETTKWRIMQKGTTIIGLFQGMFTETIMTFNPTDVRGIQKHLKANNIALLKEADETTTGPESIMLTDPDGHQILFDQHQ